MLSRATIGLYHHQLALKKLIMPELAHLNGRLLVN